MDRCTGRYCRAPAEIMYEGEPLCPTHLSVMLEERMTAAIVALHDGRV